MICGLIPTLSRNFTCFFKKLNYARNYYVPVTASHRVKLVRSPVCLILGEKIPKNRRTPLMLSLWLNKNKMTLYFYIKRKNHQIFTKGCHFRMTLFRFSDISFQ